MQNPNDYVLVNGNLTISTSAEATLKSGIIEVKRNITQKTGGGYSNYKYGFNQSGGFVLKLSWSNVQEISIEDYSY